MRSGRVRRAGTWFATWLVAWGVFVPEQQRLELDLSEATYQKFVAGGIPYTATLQVPAPLRVQAVKVVVVYDYAADLVGSVVLKTGR